MHSRISIVVPSYNQAEYLDAALSSLLAQGYPDLELIVMDGGSTDASPAVISRFEERIAYWQSQPDGGQSAALAEGFRLASGDILGWLNSDDLLLPGALHKVAEHFESHPQCAWLYGNSHVVDEGGDLIWRRVVPRVSAFQLVNLTLYLPQESTFFRRTLYDRTEGVDPVLQYAMDYDLWLKFFKVAPPDHLHDFLGCFRLVSGQKSSQMTEYRAEERVVKARMGHGPASTARVTLAKVNHRARSMSARLAAEGSLALWSLGVNQLRVLRGGPEARGGSKRFAVASLSATGMALVGVIWSMRALTRRRSVSGRHEPSDR